MSEARLDRFDVNERVLHLLNAALFAVLMVTAVILYVAPISALVGRRGLIREIHVISGLALPLPLVLGLVGPWRRALRADIATLARWDAADRRWLRSFGRDRRVRMGKFHPGQKLNAAFTLGFIGVFLGTGAIMRWFGPFPLAWRTGATFVHDWSAIAAVVVITGHVYMALGDGDALRSMVRGWVPAEWARKKCPKWFEQRTGQPAGRPLDPAVFGSDDDQARVVG